MEFGYSPACTLGDPVYSLPPFFVKEFFGWGTILSEQFFGRKLSSGCMVIECSFGRLKGWLNEALRRPIDTLTEYIPSAIVACFELHVIFALTLLNKIMLTLM